MKLMYHSAPYYDCSYWLIHPQIYIPELQLGFEYQVILCLLYWLNFHCRNHTTTSQVTMETIHYQNTKKVIEKNGISHMQKISHLLLYHFGGILTSKGITNRWNEGWKAAHTYK